jgi:hypothetical protein
MIVARQFIAWDLRQTEIRPVRDGMIESDRRATIRTINLPGVRIRPCPTGQSPDVPLRDKGHGPAGRSPTCPCGTSPTDVNAAENMNVVQVQFRSDAGADR